MSDIANAQARQQPMQDGLQATATPNEALHGVVTLMKKVSSGSSLGSINPDLAGMIGKLAEQAAEPGRLDQPSFRTGAAYALQDIERYADKPVSMPPELRAELAALAGTSPGLQNGRMQALVAKTAELDDRELILDIRRTAQQVARLGSSQDGTEVVAQIEALEKRAGIGRGQDAAVSNDVPASQARQNDAVPAGQDKLAAEQTATTSTSGAANKEAPAKESNTSAGASSIEQRVSAVPSPGSGQLQAAPATGDIPAGKPAQATTASQPGPATPAEQPRPQGGAAQVQPQGVAERIMSSTRSPRSLDPAPWSVPVPAIGQRIAQFEQRLTDNRTERFIQNAEKSGAAMLAAMEHFANGPGRSIMGKLEGAASQDLGGMPAVISEMRPGGRYAAERVEFDTELRTPTVGAAYKAVTDSADKFAADRYAVANNLNSRKLDPAAADGRFEQLDAALGEQASKLPGREAGKDAVAEMAQKLADLLRKAVAKVEQAFGETADVQAQATTRPNPSPSASM